MPCYSPLKGYKNGDTGGWQGRREGSIEKMEVSCGQCLGCRLDRSRMWAVRIIHESSLHEFDEGNSFVTLTYDDEHVPADWSLNKNHFRNFVRRLRRGHDGQRIRYFHCGEYGDICRHGVLAKNCSFCSVGRPHYHACLFNCSFRDLVPVGKRNDVVYYTSDKLQSFWPHGFVQVGELNFESAAYVSRYCLKKVNGAMAQDHYMQIDEYGVASWVEPEYVTMSRRPGIAKEWFDRFKDDCFPADEVPVVGKGVIKKVPRYYEELMKSEDEGVVEEAKKLRKLFRKMHEEEYTGSRLMQKYRVKKRQKDLLRRNLDG